MWSQVEGFWFDADSSKASAATLTLNVTAVTVRFEDRVETARLAEVEISPRLGNTPRRLTFPNGGLFETSANDAIDHMLERTGTGHAGWLHWLEQRWQLAVLMIVPAAVLLWLAATFGVPALAQFIAARMPPAVARTMAEEVIDSIPRFGFEETQLSDQQRAFLEREFRRLTAPGAGLPTAFLRRARHRSERVRVTGLPCRVHG